MAAPTDSTDGVDDHRPARREPPPPAADEGDGHDDTHDTHDTHDEAPGGHAQPAGAKKKPRLAWILGAIAVVGLVVGVVVWLLGRGKESTDDAALEGHVISVSARVTGVVARLAVRDNEVVEAGQVLLELDPADYQAHVAQARADLMAAQAQLAQSRSQLAITQRSAAASVTQARGGVEQAAGAIRQADASVSQARADVAAAQDRLRLANDDAQRATQLFSVGAIARAEYDQRASAVAQARAQLAEARARLATAGSGVESSTGGLETAQGRMAQAQTVPEQVDAARAMVAAAEARVAQMQAALDLAQLNLGYTTVRAPARGVVSRRTAEVGQTVGPDRPLLAVVPTEDVWVVANFKETQVGHLRAGQHATVHVDAYPGRAFGAHVDSIAEASGSRFSLLPPDNATGNYVKVVQRIPVLLRFDAHPGVPLRPGMNVEATVHTGT